MLRPRGAALIVLGFGLGCATFWSDRAPFMIRVVDPEGRPLACVRLITPQQIVLTTDRDGLASFYEPGQMHGQVFFTPLREGWQHAPDATGIRGRALAVEPGGSATLYLTPVGPTPDCDAPIRPAQARVPDRSQLFGITLVDAATGRGVPRVELRAPDGASWISDSAGVIAFDDIKAMGRPARFEVTADGYRLPDASGAVLLEPREGGRARVELERLDIAERLYRVTGAGIYRDSWLLGLPVPIRHPLGSGGVAGQDSVQAALYRGRILWTWGDTPSVAHPLWNFSATGATSKPPAEGGLDPASGVDLEYFVNRHGLVRPFADIPGPGATWLGGLVNLPDARGEETLLAFYGKHLNLSPAEEYGIAHFDPASDSFVRDRVLPAALPTSVRGSLLRVNGADGEFVVFGDDLRIPARAESLRDPTTWEFFTPFEAADRPVDRGPDGRVRYAWRRGVPLAEATEPHGARLAPDERLADQVRDVTSGERVRVHSASTSANAHRGRFVRIFTEFYGTPSRLGEVWYAEADTPMGLWHFARKIVSHRQYTFYNPFQHALFAQQGGRTLFFEGTYTAAFSDVLVPTPRYDYNQIMHRLDLDDPRLFLPVPIYDLGVSGRPERFADKRALRPGDGDPPVAFWAHDRPAPGSVPVWWSGAACGERRLVAGGMPATQPLFHAYPAAEPPALPSRLPLVVVPPGASSAGAPLAFVLANPLRATLPVSAYLPELIADAGSDRCAREPSAGEGARVTLDAAGSRSPPGTRHAWSWPGGSADGTRAEARLPAGLHRVRLELTTGDGMRASDELVVEIARAGAPR